MGSRECARSSFSLSSCRCRRFVELASAARGRTVLHPPLSWERCAVLALRDSMETARLVASALNGESELADLGRLPSSALLLLAPLLARLSSSPRPIGSRRRGLASAKVSAPSTRGCNSPKLALVAGHRLLRRVLAPTRSTTSTHPGAARTSAVGPNTCTHRRRATRTRPAIVVRARHALTFPSSPPRPRSTFSTHPGKVPPLGHERLRPAELGSATRRSARRRPSRRRLGTSPRQLAPPPRPCAASPE